MSRSGFFDASSLPPSPHDADLQRARSAVLAAIESSDWQPNGTKDGVQLFTNPSAPFPATKGIAVAKAHPLLVHTLFGDTDHRKAWDPMVESIRTLECIDRLTYIGYSLFRAPWPVSRRDMHIIGRGERVAKDGSYFTYGTSVTRPPTSQPPPRGVIRAQLLYYGTYITPLTDGRCRVTFVACSDPKGMLPTVLVSAAAQLQPLNINRIVALCNKPGMREETERKLMASIREAGFDEEEGRFNDKTAAVTGTANGKSVVSKPTEDTTQEDEGEDGVEEEEDEAEQSAAVSSAAA